MGNVDQMSNVALAGVLAVQTSRRSRRHDAEDTVNCHLQHTCTTVTHDPSFFVVDSTHAEIQYSYEELLGKDVDFDASNVVAVSARFGISISSRWPLTSGQTSGHICNALGSLSLG